MLCLLFYNYITLSYFYKSLIRHTTTLYAEKRNLNGEYKMKNNIVLIGMPASGKSTVGVIAAKILGKDFIDSDLLVQKLNGKKLHEIIAERGVDGFLKAEDEALSSITAENAVIATGGSAVYNRRGMEHLKDIGTVVYLYVPEQELLRRLHNIKARGVVLREGQDIRQLYKERSPLYEKYADIIISEHGGTEDTVSELVKKASLR